MQLMVLSSVITCPASNYRFLKTKISPGDKHLLHEVMWIRSLLVLNCAKG